jgi:hypothetical protein
MAVVVENNDDGDTIGSDEYRRRQSRDLWATCGSMGGRGAQEGA